MEERLKKISEEFSYLNEEKKKIESKPEKTVEDLETLAAFEELYKYMREKINNWGTEKNSINSTNYEPEEIKEKSLREQFEENRDKIDVIRNKSKSMQPPFEGIDKKRKDEILEQLGFVKTTNVDGREVRIHPSLVGTYYDLVKEQKKLTEQLNNEYYQTRDKRDVTAKEQPTLTEVEDIFKQAFIEEKQKNITEQEIQNDESKNIESIETKEQELIKKKQSLELERDNILNNESGRKQFVKYKQQQYYIPRYYSGYFPVLLHEIEKIEEELNGLKAKDNLSEEPIDIQEEIISEEKQVEKIMTEFFVGEQPIKEESVILESNNNENSLNNSFKKNILDKIEKAKTNQKEVEHLSFEIPTISTNIESKTETEKVKDIFDEFLNLENNEPKEEIQDVLEIDSKKTEEKPNRELEEISKILENFTSDYMGEVAEEKNSSTSHETENEDIFLGEYEIGYGMRMLSKKYKDKSGKTYLETEIFNDERKIKHFQKIDENGDIYYSYQNKTPIKYYKNEVKEFKELKAFGSDEIIAISLDGEIYDKKKDELGNVYLEGSSKYLNYSSNTKLIEKIDENGQVYYEGEKVEESTIFEKELKKHDPTKYEPIKFEKEETYEDDLEEEFDDDYEEDLDDDYEDEYEEINEEEFENAYSKKSSEFDNSPIDTNITKEEIKEKRSNKILSGIVTKVRKASSNMSKQAKISAALIATSLVILVTGIIATGKNKEKIDEPIFTTTEEQLDNEESMLYENALKNHLQELKKSMEEDKKESLTENVTDETIEEEKMAEENSLQIGKTIKINEDAKIYRNGYDAYLNESAFNPYYDSEDNRVILGVGIMKEETLTYVFACDENANVTINNLINEGGEVVSILTANKDRYLSDYDGNDILTEDEINAYAEGWYNLDGVKLENTKGKSM